MGIWFVLLGNGWRKVAECRKTSGRSFQYHILKPAARGNELLYTYGNSSRIVCLRKSRKSFFYLIPCEFSACVKARLRQVGDFRKSYQDTSRIPKQNEAAMYLKQNKAADSGAAQNFNLVQRMQPSVFLGIV